MMHLLIQSVYSDEQVSRTRLGMSVLTVVPALASQTVKPVVVLAVNPDDPLLEERLGLFEGTGCEIQTVKRHAWRLYGEDWNLPIGRKVVGRVDDDDVLCKTFCEETLRAAEPLTESALLWPNGYTFWNGNVYSLHHLNNQFVAMVTEKDADPHKVCHTKVRRYWPVATVSEKPGWIWVRHGAAHTSTLGKYRQNLRNGIDSTRFAVNLRAVDRLVSKIGS